MSEGDGFELVTADRKTTYSSLQDLYLDVANQLKDGEGFSIVDGTGAVIITGVWHPLTPSRF